MWLVTRKTKRLQGGKFQPHPLAGGGEVLEIKLYKTLEQGDSEFPEWGIHPPARSVAHLNSTGTDGTALRTPPDLAL